MLQLHIVTMLHFVSPLNKMILMKPIPQLVEDLLKVVVLVIISKGLDIGWS